MNDDCFFPQSKTPVIERDLFRCTSQLRELITKNTLTNWNDPFIYSHKPKYNDYQHPSSVRSEN